MRAFFCIPIDEALREEIAGAADAIRRRTGTRASWVRPRNYHITIRFLGEIDPLMTVELERIARAAGVRAFAVTIDRIGAFPTVERPRVIWAGGEAPPGFVELASSLNGSLERLGFPRGRDEKIVHITIARVKGKVDPGLVEGIRSTGIPSMRFTAARIVLMESRLTPRGPIYSPLFTIELERGDRNGV